jgi:GntR family transcriptional regulator
MRIWLSRNGGTSLRDQLTTQLMLGVMSEELKAGEKLPSVREMARRCQIHANTASAAYRDLEARGWVEFRKGSGVYVRDLHISRSDINHTSLDDLIERFLANTRVQGFSMSEVQARMAR